MLKDLHNLSELLQQDQTWIAVAVASVVLIAVCQVIRLFADSKK